MQHCLPFGRFSGWHILFFIQSIVLLVKAALLIFTAVVKKKRLRIIVADDEEDDRDIFTTIVKQVAPDTLVEEAYNGAQLMQRLTSESPLPHLIFLDLNMPGLEGLDCLKRIRSDKKLKEIPVIIYAASAYKEDIENTYKNGADYYITKPYQITDMAQIFKSLLSREWAVHASPVREQFVWSSKG